MAMAPTSRSVSLPPRPSLAGDAVRPFGTLQYIGSGDAAGFDANPEARLIDLVHTLKSGHRQGAAWVMNSATLAQVRKLKTADGAFLWQPGLVEGQPDRLLGYPVVEAEDMPDVARAAFRSLSATSRPAT
jgi:HK97 family phage major capsid protein